jgi:Fasciclin domain
MTRALDQNYRFTITIPTIKYAMVMMSDVVLKKRGYDYSTALSAWTYTTPGTTTTTSGNVPRDNLQRVLGTHIIPITAGELDDISGSGIIETASGDYIKWNAGKFSSAGSIDSAYTVNTSSTKTSFNGRVFYADNLLTFSVRSFGLNIKDLGGTSAATSQFYNFFQYLTNASIYTAATGAILGVQPGVFYTSFIPNNAAIVQAVKDGILPGTPATGVPNFLPTLQSDKDLVNNFILYHILNKTTVVPDGKKFGTYETLFKNISGDPGQLIITNSLNNMQIKDNYGRISKVVTASSNNLADRCVIHLIDNYLKYNPN